MAVWVCKYARTNYESRRGHMKQPIDKYYSIAFERFELGSNHFDLLKYIQREYSLIQYLIQLEFQLETFESIRSRAPSGAFTRFTSFNFHLERLQIQTGTFTRFTSFNVHEVHRLRIPSGT